MHEREHRGVPRDGAQGDREERVVHWSRGSLGADETPLEHDALTRYELDDLAFEAANVDTGVRMPDAVAAAHAGLDLCPFDRDAARSQPALQEIGIEPGAVDVIRRGRNHPLESDNRRCLPPSHRVFPLFLPTGARSSSSESSRAFQKRS